MRSYSISQLILLLCAFAAAASTPCLIQSGPGINFDPNTNQLTCTPQGNTLRGIEFASSLYDSLKCDEVEGWKSKRLVWNETVGKDEWEEYVVADSSTPFTVNCVEYCTSTGDGIIVNIDQNETIDGQNSIEISCADPSLGLYHIRGLMTKRKAHCSMKDKWQSAGWNYETDSPLSSYPGAKISNDIRSPQQFECKEVPRCSVNFQEETNLDSTKTLTCIYPSEVIWTIWEDMTKIITLSQKSLKCDEVDGWSNENGERIAKADTQLDIFCSKPPCSFLPAEGLHFDDSTKKITCNGGNYSFGAVEVDSQRYRNIECDKTFWKIYRPKEPKENIAWALTPLPATCVQYCTATGNGTVIEKIDNEVESGVLVTCLDPALELYHERGLMNDGKAWCKGDDGWRSTGFEITDEIFSTARFECKRAPLCSFNMDDNAHFDNSTNTLSCLDESNVIHTKENSKKREYDSLKCDEVDGWSNGIKADIPLYYVCSPPIPKCSFYPAEGLLFDDFTKTLSCNSGENDLRALRVDNSLHSYLTCDEVNGWMDGNKISIAPADKRISAFCSKYCEVSSGVEVRKDGIDSLTASCSDNSEKLFFNYDKPVVRATCRLEGWSIEMEGESKTATSEYSPDLRCEIPRDSSTDSRQSSDEAEFKWTNPWVIAGIIGVIIIIAIITIVVAVVCCRKQYVDYNTDYEPQTDQKYNSETVDEVIVETPSEQ